MDHCQATSGSIPLSLRCPISVLDAERINLISQGKCSAGSSSKGSPAAFCSKHVQEYNG